MPCLWHPEYLAWARLSSFTTTLTPIFQVRKPRQEPRLPGKGHTVSDTDYGAGSFPSSPHATARVSLPPDKPPEPVHLPWGPSRVPPNPSSPPTDGLSPAVESPPHSSPQAAACLTHSVTDTNVGHTHAVSVSV